MTYLKNLIKIHFGSLLAWLPGPFTKYLPKLLHPDLIQLQNSWLFLFCLAKLSFIKSLSLDRGRIFVSMKYMKFGFKKRKSDLKFVAKNNFQSYLSLFFVHLLLLAWDLDSNLGTSKSTSRCHDRNLRTNQSIFTEKNKENYWNLKFKSLYLCDFANQPWKFKNLFVLI